MDYQLSFSFIGSYPRKFHSQKLLSTYDIALGIIDEQRLKELMFKDDKALQADLRHISHLAKNPDLRSSGIVHLTEEASNEYYPENFHPRLWVTEAEKLQGEKQFGPRPIYKLLAEKRDGTKSYIMIKGIKKGYSFYPSTSGSALTGISRFNVFCKSRTEYDRLLYLKGRGVAVEKPLGYFSSGLEQWLYTEYIDGINPAKMLLSKEAAKRNEVWNADAKLLADLCNAHIVHQYFYDEGFDDKVFSDGRMVLIDTDESRRMYSKNGLKKISSKERKEKFKKYFVGWLQDCIRSYIRSNNMDSLEAKTYAATFLKNLNINIGNAQDLAKDIDPNALTADEYESMVRDCD